MNVTMREFVTPPGYHPTHKIGFGADNGVRDRSHRHHVAESWAAIRVRLECYSERNLLIMFPERCFQIVSPV